MSRTRFPLLAAALLAALVLGCNGEDSQSPTGPGSITRFNIVLISPLLNNALQKAKLTLDGRDLVEVTALGGGSPITPLDASVSGVSRGVHTLRVVVVEQSSSPNSYIASGAIVTPDRIIEIAPVQGSLRTGEGLEIRVTF